MRLTVRLTLLLIVLGLTCAAPAAAQQQDTPGSKDHPAAPRMAGYYISGYALRDFDGSAFPLGDDKELRVEGKLTEITYRITDDAKMSSALEIARNYTSAFRAKGGQVRFSDPDNIHTTLSMTSGGSETWCHVSVSNRGESYTLTIVEEVATVSDPERSTWGAMGSHGEEQNQRQSFEELFESLSGAVLLLIFPTEPHGPPC